MTDRERWEDLGCGDGGCVFRTPTGMHTNAGCKCVPRTVDYDTVERSRLRRWISVMRDRIVAQERDLERVQGYRADAHAALAEAARAFQADDREALRLILCDQNARSLAFRLRKEQEEKERELAEARRRVAIQDAHIESMLRFICEAHDYLRGKGNPDLPAWVLSGMAQEILDCVPEDKCHD